MLIFRNAARDFATDLKAGRHFWPGWTLMVSFPVGAVAVMVGLDAIQKEYLEYPLLVTLAAFAFIIFCLKPTARNRPWFWMTLGILAAVHASLIVLIHWPAKSPRGVAFGGAAILDSLIMLAVIDSVARFTAKRPRTRLRRPPVAGPTA